MTTENKRDLAADLAICEAATAGPVHYMRSIHSEYHYEVCNRNFLDTVIATTISEADARMFAEAFEGWPEAIRRAMAAEEQVGALIELLRETIDMITPNETDYKCDYRRRYVRHQIGKIVPEVGDDDTQENNGR